MKPIFCGNFEYDARQPDLERLFSRYGKVDRVDMKSGELLSVAFFFVCLDSFFIFDEKFIRHILETQHRTFVL